MYAYSDYTAEQIAQRRAAKARWKALQDRMDARSYREALAMLEPDEPVFRLAAAYAHEMED